MPVPVPPRVKPAANANIKRTSFDLHAIGNAKRSALKHLLNSLPSPPDLPPAFADRETWIRSLPPQRRFKNRDEHVPPPPLYTNLKHARISPSAVNVKSLDSAVAAPTRAPLNPGRPWPPSPPSSADVAAAAAALQSFSLKARSVDSDHGEEWTEDEVFFAGPALHRSLPEAAQEIKTRSQPVPDQSYHPPQMVSDLDIPIAPFNGTLVVPPPYLHEDGDVAAPAHGNVSSSDAPVSTAAARKLPTPIPTHVTPAGMTAYRKTADPIADWVALYIWKVTTQGMSLPPKFVCDGSGNGQLSRSYPTHPASHLAEGIRSLLHATLLPPSAIFLALWYIARLPVFMGRSSFDPVLEGKEYRFCVELFGERQFEPAAEAQEVLEAHAPFRLLLLGVMLANKWLDDNTFSNKTWHQVSGVPVRALNKLENLGLDLLSHDLSVPPKAWTQWLDYIQKYHRALAQYPEPIGPPKETPHVIIRRVIDELIVISTADDNQGGLPQPVFLGIDERRKEREQDSRTKDHVDLQELDLDEDGPLRQEYLPKRHKEAGSQGKGKVSRQAARLPPPSAWSPEADPPLYRSRSLNQAVQRLPVAPVSSHIGAAPSSVIHEGSCDPFARGAIHTSTETNAGVNVWNASAPADVYHVGSRLAVPQRGHMYAPLPPSYFAHYAYAPQVGGTTTADHHAVTNSSSLVWPAPHNVDSGVRGPAPAPDGNALVYSRQWVRI